MRTLFQEELTVKMMLDKMKKEIKEEQLEKALCNLENYNSARKKIITKCDIAFYKNKMIK